MKNVNRPRWPVILIGTLACLAGIWTSGREGLGQLLAARSAKTKESKPVNQALRLAPAIPEAHYLLANLLADAGDLANSIKEYERAVALRPSDYALWLNLGLARDRAGDAEGAISAFRESVAQAPFYSQPHWQLGNTLYRLGRVDEAVKELVIAARSNPKLASQAIALLWPALHNDVQAIERATAPQTQAMNLALARLLVKQDKIEDAMKHFRQAGGLSNEDQRLLVEDLLARKNFDAAYEVWSSNSSERKIAGDYVENGGFEETVRLDRVGFGWQFGQGTSAVKAVLDADEHYHNAYSMRIDWDGNSDPNAATAWQLILVNPKTRYRLSFAARTLDMTTIGLPIVSVIDPTPDPMTPLAPPVTLPRGSTGWVNYSIEFVTGDQTRAARITIARANCSSPPCPAFGSAWFDDFSVIKLGN